MFGQKTGPGNKGKNCGLQGPNELFCIFLRHQSIIQALCNDGNFVKVASVDKDTNHQGKEMCQFSD